MNLSLFRRTLLPLALLGYTALCGACTCSGSAGPDVGSESHWLERCESTRDCSAGLACWCGVCTVSCDAQESCEGESIIAQCVPARDTAPECGATLGWASGICLAKCAMDSECAAIDSEMICGAKGLCERAQLPPAMTPVQDMSSMPDASSLDMREEVDASEDMAQDMAQDMSAGDCIAVERLSPQLLTRHETAPYFRKAVDGYLDGHVRLLECEEPQGCQSPELPFEITNRCDRAVSAMLEWEADARASWTTSTTQDFALDLSQPGKTLGTTSITLAPNQTLRTWVQAQPTQADPGTLTVTMRAREEGAAWSSKQLTVEAAGKAFEFLRGNTVEPVFDDYPVDFFHARALDPSLRTFLLIDILASDAQRLGVRYPDDYEDVSDEDGTDIPATKKHRGLTLRAVTESSSGRPGYNKLELRVAVSGDPEEGEVIPVYVTLYDVADPTEHRDFVLPVVVSKKAYEIDLQRDSPASVMVSAQVELEVIVTASTDATEAQLFEFDSYPLTGGSLRGVIEVTAPEPVMLLPGESRQVTWTARVPEGTAAGETENIRLGANGRATLRTPSTYSGTEVEVVVAAP